MEEANKTKVKIILWDQLIRPLYSLLKLYILQALLIVLMILNLITWKNGYAFWIITISLGIIFTYQFKKYLESGEWMHNYRKFKSDRGEYKDYRKLTKILKKENKSTPETKLVPKELVLPKTNSSPENINKIEKEAEEIVEADKLIGEANENNN